MLNKDLYLFNSNNSLLSKINPLVKFCGLFIYILVSLFKYNNYLFIFNISLVFLYMLLSNVSIKLYFKRILKYIPFFIILYFVLLSNNVPISNIIIISFKIIFLFMYIYVIFYTTSSDDLIYAISHFLSFFNVFGIYYYRIEYVVRRFVLSIYYFFDSQNKIISSLNAKGIDTIHVNLIKRFYLFIKYFSYIKNDVKDMVQLNIREMDKKLYYNKRSKYNMKLAFLDFVFLFINIGMIVYYGVIVR